LLTIPERQQIAKEEMMESGDTAMLSSSIDFSTDIEKEQDVFQKARQFLKPGPLFRAATYLYAERKLLVFFWVHFMATMIVWSKFCCS
jgi:hypothetical protein